MCACVEFPKNLLLFLGFIRKKNGIARSYYNNNNNNNESVEYVIICCAGILLIDN